MSSREVAQVVTVSSRVAHETPFVTVHEDAVVFATGREGSYTTITPGSGFGGLVIVRARTKGGPMYGLVTQYRYPGQAQTLEFPRGGTSDLSAGEAMRELVEEIGGGSGVRPDLLGYIHPDTGILTTKVSVWLATLGELPDVTHSDAESGGRVRWVNEAEMCALIHSGKVTCAMSLAAFALLLTSPRHLMP